MPIFNYAYLNSKGKRQSGQLEASSEGEAKEKLRRQGTIVLAFFTAETKQKKIGFKKKRALKGKNLQTFTTQLSQLLLAGVPLYESLLSLEEQYRQEDFHPILLSLCDQIKGGASLSDALGKFPESFNRLYCAMVAAGEAVGILDKTLEKLAVLLAKQATLRKHLTTALLYPLLLCAFSCGVIILLLTFVIPSLEMIFEDRQVNRFTSIVIGLSHFLTGSWPFYVPFMGTLVSGCTFLLRTPRGKRLFQKQLLKIPLLRTILTQAALARFCRTMGTLLHGGAAILHAMQIARQVMRNPFLEEIIEKAEERIVAGSFLSVELRKSSLIPPLVPRMLAIGEEGGNTAFMLEKIAELYEEETEKTLGRLTALAQPVILIVMGGIVGIIMLAVLLPLTDVNAFLHN